MWKAWRKDLCGPRHWKMWEQFTVEFPLYSLLTFPFVYNIWDSFLFIDCWEACRHRAVLAFWDQRFFWIFWYFHGPTSHVRIDHTGLSTDPCNIFVDEGELSSESTEDCQRLGPAGLALHYANIIIQIYSVVSSLRFCLRRLPKIWHDLAILS